MADPDETRTELREAKRRDRQGETDKGVTRAVRSVDCRTGSIGPVMIFLAVTHMNAHTRTQFTCLKKGTINIPSHGCPQK